MKPPLGDGAIVTCADGSPPFGGRYYVLMGGTRRWICTPEAAQRHHLSLSGVIPLAVEELKRYRLASPVSTFPDTLAACRDGTEVRAFLLKDLRGRGIEFGPGGGAIPLPLACETSYADQYSPGESGAANRYFTDTEFLEIQHHTTMDRMDGIEDGSLDYILSSHVIEHVPRTIAVLEAGRRKLRMGGSMFFAVPHRDHTFDRGRPLTSLEHFISDYRDYRAERDLLHVIDNYQHVDFIRKQFDAVGFARGAEAFSGGNGKIDLHYHTFTEENFSAAIDWFCQNVAPFSARQVISRIEFQGANEFYAVLVK